MAVHNYTIRLNPPDSYRRVVTWSYDGDPVDFSGYTVLWTIQNPDEDINWTEDDPEVDVDTTTITLTIFDTEALAAVEAGWHTLVVTDSTGFKTTLLDGRVTNNG